MSIELLTSSYDYELPERLIATKPIYPRDHAKLLVYDRATDSVTHTTVEHLLEFVPPQCAIILNDTRVIKARIFGHKSSGGKIELLLNKPIDSSSYTVLIRGRVKVGTVVTFDRGLTATVTQLNEDGSRIVTFAHHSMEILFEKLVLILDEIGHIPLPPYIHREDTQEDERDYQTLFADHAGAVAAPTASLHFTPELLSKLMHRHDTHKVTLHVGAGTFKPVDADMILDHPMHSESFLIPDDTQRILESSRAILAVGTTVTRTVEYHARTAKTQGECDLFLNPSNPPIRVDHLLTNFHLPKSTLIMLVSAFVGRQRALALYSEAIDREYRFFSYGDAMLII